WPSGIAASRALNLAVLVSAIRLAVVRERVAVRDGHASPSVPGGQIWRRIR
ncbi:MAG: hypothetical protein QOJ32_2049, partial [Frankiaceae bacterium]|nr:hypothetical protein [Frankiaceae bacterium]